MVVAYCDGKPDPQLSAELQAVIDRWTAGGAKVELRADGNNEAGLGRPAVTSIPFEEELTREEVDRRIAEPGGKTLDEILKRLGAR